MISFFTDSSKYMDDDAFYKLDDVSGSKKSMPIEETKQSSMYERREPDILS